ncbi:hypothetical protein A3B35_00980 [Candidatus Kaiserbacteria bacterium RIFCSPLOWO2_01_FULL_54_24]|uniref:Uncharacterized protein n=1 Tax=Candidatus Kaiserbacteria bacterium RIFCSPLOWO2_01_FULL_54_24 TaxID=1798515 RepID=A0A1F6EVD9_9BACT|nr:MAG: hypothetical protein A3B35_00980 [Candidatus Kaiserbacteria bacterium RIFCSPLOWO2_01_FULL_54_24]
MTENLDTSKSFKNLRQMHADDLNKGDRVATHEGKILEVESTVAQGARMLECRLNPVSGTDKSGWGGVVDRGDNVPRLVLTQESDLLIRKLEKLEK